MASTAVVVKGLTDVTVKDIHITFEDLLQQAGYTDEFEVVYPVTKCRGIRNIDPIRPAAVLLFSDILRKSLKMFPLSSP